MHGGFTNQLSLIRDALRRLGPPTSVRVTASEATQTIKSGRTPVIIRQAIEVAGETVGQNPDDGSTTLLVFVNAMKIQRRLQKIIQRAP